MEKEYRSMLRLRMSAKDAHYGGNLVDGAHMVHLFGDVATELLIMTDGDEGLFCAYDNIEFLAPVYAGDYIEAEGWVTKIGNTSRKMEFVARKVIVPRPDISDSAADVLAEGFTGPKLEVGNLIEVKNAGAYACTLTAQRFSSHQPPRELLVYGDGHTES